ncbi:hypothetical protein GN958_ATG10021 [Phytophthora infestans]|uniref:Ubiquitin-like protease family profile domain-containing protein n=1 Tax=Phytophthora infestans TaxID=4787 RepID=A0A8S9UMY7_PHYIN|nr:hypothetical protein GN958_ATG10021 [Phytophthora infestans]
MVTALDLPHVDVSGPLTVRPYNTGEEVPVIKAIPQLDKIEEAIQAIKETGNPDLLAHWPDYGCAAFDHLDTMASTIEARHRFGLVRYTLAWIEKVTWKSGVVVDPFKDTCDVTKVMTDKTEHKAIAEKMNLGVTNVCGQRVPGHQLLDFRENTFDPQQMSSNYNILESAVKKTIQPLLRMNAMLFKKIDRCTQRDSSSCGVLCLVVLEILPAGAEWDEGMYNLVPYLRMRYFLRCSARHR